MLLLGIDIGIVLLFVLFFYLATMGESGFFSILIPYAFIGMLSWHVPLALSVVNLIIAIFTPYTILQALIPLVIPIVTISYRKIKDYYGAKHWQKYVVPLRNAVKEFMAEKGFKDPYSVSVNPYQKRVIVELYKEDTEAFAFQKKTIETELKERFLNGYYVDYKGMVFVQSHISRKTS